MTNMLADAETWLAAQYQYHVATSITYRRGGTDLSIAATPGASRHQVDQISGIISWHDKDWYIPVDVLTIGVPRIGDKIIVGSSTFEVLPPTGEECWNWHGDNETIYRIHTKRIEA